MTQTVLFNRPPRTWKLAIIIAALAFFSYINNLGHDFAFDDVSYIMENEYIKQPGHVTDIFTTTYLFGMDGFHKNLYRPVIVFSYALNTMITGLNPSSFHLVNNLIHAANSVLVFLIILAVLSNCDMAFLAALFFAAHPIHTEAVDNVVGRAELLSFLLMMLSFLLYTRMRKNPRFYYPLALAFFMGALMSKEIPAVFPLIILLMAVGKWARGECKNFERNVLKTAGFFAILGVYLLMRHAVIKRCGPVLEVMYNDNILAGVPFLERLPTALTVLVKYSVLLVSPVKLSADYTYNQIPFVDSWINPMVISGVVLVIAVMVIGIIAAMKSPGVYFGIIMLAVPFLAFSNILFTTGTIMGERLMYIPSLGFTILLAWCVLWFFRRIVKCPRYALWAAVGITVLYTGRTLARNPDWKDNATIFTKTVKTSPNSAKNNYNYALLLKREDRINEAIDALRRTVTIWPGHQRGWFNLGGGLAEIKHYEEAVEAYHRSLEILPDHPDALHNLAITYRNMNEPEKSVETFKKILEIDPLYQSARLNIGNTWVQAGDYDRALEAFEENILINPGDYDSMTNIGNIYLVKGDTLTAEVYYRRSIDINPENANARNMLLTLLLNQNRLEEAGEKIREMQTKKITMNRRLFMQYKEKLRK
ncbi:tetratricopeptide repeat protein [Candidatus Latescibacterota bacterium]